MVGPVVALVRASGCVAAMMRWPIRSVLTTAKPIVFSSSATLAVARPLFQAPSSKTSLFSASLYTIKGICILDNDGERVLCKYFDDQYSTVKEQRAFETSLFQKTQRANSEIIMFEGITCVYRSNVDLFFYVFGSSNENELILASVLTALYDAISIILRENVEKSLLFEAFGQVLLIIDECVDGGIIMETDPLTLAKSAEGSPSKDAPLSEKNMAQAGAQAMSFLKRAILT